MNNIIYRRIIIFKYFSKQVDLFVTRVISASGKYSLTDRSIGTEHSISPKLMPNRNKNIFNCEKSSW